MIPGTGFNFPHSVAQGAKTSVMTRVRPGASIAPQPAPHPAAVARPASPCACPMSAKVLIVEDEFLIALQLEAMLTSAGCRVVGILSDRQGLEDVADPPEVALVDLNLRDGATGCEIAQHLSHRFGTTIVYVTANPGQIAEAAPTAIGIVPKPFSQVAIETAVALARTVEPSPPPSPAALPLIDGRTPLD